MGPDEQSALRARLLGAHVQALADRGRDDEATRAGDEAVALAERVGLRDVADEVRVVVAKVRSAPATLRSRRRRWSASSRTPPSGAPLPRAGLCTTSAPCTTGPGGSPRRSRSTCWAPPGPGRGPGMGALRPECRLLAGIAAYEHGDWPRAEEILGMEGEAVPQPARALLQSARLYVAAGRETAALAVLPEVRRWWETDGLVALLSASAAVDLYGDSGDLGAAIGIHDEVVELLTRLWRPGFQARIRLSALVLGQLGTHAAHTTTAERRHLLDRGEELAVLVAEVAAVGGRRPCRPRGGRVGGPGRAELLRLRWLAGGSSPDVGAMEAGGPRWSIGSTPTAMPSRLPLPRTVGGGTPGRGLGRDRCWWRGRSRRPAVSVRARCSRSPAPDGWAGPRSAGRHARRGPLPREREILGLVALGRSNKQIGAQLFISAKTASVHVSNIMAKLGAAGRGEAAVRASAGSSTDAPGGPGPTGRVPGRGPAGPEQVRVPFLYVVPGIT